MYVCMYVCMLEEALTLDDFNWLLLRHARLVHVFILAFIVACWPSHATIYRLLFINQGGAIYNTGGSVSIVNSVLSGNTAVSLVSLL